MNFTHAFEAVRSGENNEYAIKSERRKQCFEAFPRFGCHCRQRPAVPKCNSLWSRRKRANQQASRRAQESQQGRRFKEQVARLKKPDGEIEAGKKQV